MEITTGTPLKGRFQFSYEGDGTDMAILMLKNLFLTIITLGIYRAWAKTNTRRFLWENTKFMGDGATYVGTGGELFRGWMKLIGILLGFIIAISILQVFMPSLGAILRIAMPFVYIFIFALATYSGLRYRLSRTLWRQIRFGVDKDEASTKSFLALYLKGVGLSFLTLGIYYPYFKNQMRRFLTNKSRFGSAYFSYDGPDNEYFWMCIKGFFLSVITLGFYTPWFMSQLISFRLKHTSFQGARLQFTMPGTELFVCAMVLYLGAMFTFGLAIPWVVTWTLRKVVSHISAEGELDFQAVRQMASDGSAMADDIVAEYDLDLGF